MGTTLRPARFSNSHDCLSTSAFALACTICAREGADGSCDCEEGELAPLQVLVEVGDMPMILSFSPSVLWRCDVSFRDSHSGLSAAPVLTPSGNLRVQKK